MKSCALLFLVALCSPVIAQGPVAVLDARPLPGTLLEEDLQALTGEADPLVIRLVSEEPSDLSGATHVRLRVGDEESADSRVLAERVRSAQTVILEGGGLLDWFKTLQRAQRPTRLVYALQRHSREGRPLIGIGGGGAALAGASAVLSAELKEVPRNQRRAHELQARVVLGWGPPALIDASAWGGDPMRTLRLMERSYMRRAAHLGKGSGLVFEPLERRVRVLGEGGVIFFEVDPGYRNRHDLRGGRVSQLIRGDIWELPRARLLPGSASQAPSGSLDGVGALLHAFARAPSERAVLESPYGRILLRQRSDTLLLGSGDSMRPMRAEFDLLNSP